MIAAGTAVSTVLVFEPDPVLDTPFFAENFPTRMRSERTSRGSDS